MVATSRISAKLRALALLFCAHARPRPVTRGRRDGRPPPALGTARRDRLAPTPDHRAATLGRQPACDAVGPHRPRRTRSHHADLAERPANRPTRDASSLAPRRLQGALAVAEPNTPRRAPRPGDGRARPVHGLGEQTLGGREDPRRAAQARHPRQQAYGPEVHARRAQGHAGRTAVVDFSPKPRPRDLGVRLPASLRRVLPPRRETRPRESCFR